LGESRCQHKRHSPGSVDDECAAPTSARVSRASVGIVEIEVETDDPTVMDVDDEPGLEEVVGPKTPRLHGPLGR
jgi:hypothetical protein